MSPFQHAIVALGVARGAADTGPTRTRADELCLDDQLAGELGDRALVALDPGDLGLFKLRREYPPSVCFPSMRFHPTTLR